MWGHIPQIKQHVHVYAIRSHALVYGAMRGHDLVLDRNFHVCAQSVVSAFPVISSLRSADRSAGQRVCAQSGQSELSLLYARSPGSRNFCDLRRVPRGGFDAKRRPCCEPDFHSQF